eukprot:scaffold2646_cov184-Ochromonas_danica.AAC.7
MMWMREGASVGFSKANNNNLPRVFHKVSYYCDAREEWVGKKGVLSLLSISSSSTSHAGQKERPRPAQWFRTQFAR